MFDWTSHEFVNRNPSPGPLTGKEINEAVKSIHQPNT